jgi:predicted PurR-regulated permease PerM
MHAERLLSGLLIAALAVCCAMVLRPFASAIVWAMTLVFCSWPIHARLRRTSLGAVGSALCMVLGFALLAALPVAVAAPSGAADAADIRTWIQSVLASGLPSAPAWLYGVPIVGSLLADVWNGWAADLSVMFAFFKPYLGAAAAEGLTLLLDVAHALAALVFALFISFFLFLSGDVLLHRLLTMSRRIGGDAGERMLLAMGRTVRGTVYALLGTAAVQGVVTYIGLAIAGVGRAPLLALIAGFLSLLPIGAPLVWIPSALWLLATGHTEHGIFLAIYGVAIISGSDHVVRPWLISRGSRLPFVLTVLGVLGGVIAFGLIGLFLGPMLLGAGYALVDTYSMQPAPDEEQRA